MRDDWYVRLTVRLPRDSFGKEYPDSEMQAIRAAIRFWELEAIRGAMRASTTQWDTVVEVRRARPPSGDPFPSSGLHTWRRVRGWWRWPFARANSRDSKPRTVSAGVSFRATEQDSPPDVANELGAAATADDVSEIELYSAAELEVIDDHDETSCRVCASYVRWARWMAPNIVELERLWSEMNVDLAADERTQRAYAQLVHVRAARRGEDPLTWLIRQVRRDPSNQAMDVIEKAQEKARKDGRR